MEPTLRHTQWQLNGGHPCRLGMGPRFSASYLFQLVLSGESSGHCLDEVGEGEGATAVTAGRREEL